MYKLICIHSIITTIYKAIYTNSIVILINTELYNSPIKVCFYFNYVFICFIDVKML